MSDMETVVKEVNAILDRCPPPIADGMRVVTSALLMYEAEITALRAQNATLLEALEDCLSDMRFLRDAPASDYARPDPAIIEAAEAALKAAKGER